MRLEQLFSYLAFMVVRGFYALCRCLPLRCASALGGACGRALGPWTKRHRLVLQQMHRHVLHMSPARINEEAIIMWENLGRTLAEYPHLAGDQIAANITIEGLEHVEAVRASGKSALFISGHIGNWEIIPKALSMASLPVHVVYRSPNNPYLTQLLDHTRSAYALGHYNKGNEGARGVVAAIKANEPIAMLIDQKENNGALIPFLEAPAMTMLSAAKMAIKYGVPLIPIRIIRTQGVHFKAIISAPLSLANDEIAIMHQLNDLLSAWIREIPSQWFWVHKRWPKEGNA